jgi:hypothetical protein
VLEVGKLSIPDRARGRLILHFHIVIIVDQTKGRTGVGLTQLVCRPTYPLNLQGTRMIILGFCTFSFDGFAKHNRQVDVPDQALPFIAAYLEKLFLRVGPIEYLSTANSPLTTGSCF